MKVFTVSKTLLMTLLVTTAALLLMFLPTTSLARTQYALSEEHMEPDEYFLSKNGYWSVYVSIMDGEPVCVMTTMDTNIEGWRFFASPSVGLYAMGLLADSWLTSGEARESADIEVIFTSRSRGRYTWDVLDAVLMELDNGMVGFRFSVENFEFMDTFADYDTIRFNDEPAWSLSGSSAATEDFISCAAYLFDDPA